MAERIYNFSAGPGVLPEEVLRQIQQDVWNIAGSGIGVLEHSHRGKVIDKVFEECEADFRRVGSIPEEYKILFLTGGASQQAYQVPMNFLGQGQTADYLLTGYWAEKAYKTAKSLGSVHAACSSKDSTYSFIPGADQTTYSSNPVYAHFTSNNTIFGTEFQTEPTPPPGVPLICDMSSDIFSRPLDVRKYAFIYAGAQKNLGPAGVTIVIAHADQIERGSKNLPDLLQYRTFVPELSRPNTPPVFAVYAVGLVLKWILKNGGLEGMAKRNKDKARPIYDVLDTSRFYKGHARSDSRSLMNITFTSPSPELDEKFCAEAKKAGFEGLKGHRSVGGMRASVYNAFPPQGAVELAKFMRDFEKRNG